MSVCNFLRPRTFSSFLLSTISSFFWFSKFLWDFCWHNIFCSFAVHSNRLWNSNNEWTSFVRNLCHFFYYFSSNEREFELSLTLFWIRRSFGFKSLQKYGELRNEETMGIDQSLNSNWYWTKETKLFSQKGNTTTRKNEYKGKLEIFSTIDSRLPTLLVHYYYLFEISYCNEWKLHPNKTIKRKLKQRKLHWNWPSLPTTTFGWWFFSILSSSPYQEIHVFVSDICFCFKLVCCALQIPYRIPYWRKASNIEHRMLNIVESPNVF